MDEEKVSIIIPIYNGEKYIDSCLKSVLEQTYKNVEIIVVNDGSKDDSLILINKYKKSDDRIIVIDKKNEGVSVARNTAIDISTSKWIMFVDVDDKLEKDAVENLMNNIENDIDIIISKIYLVSENKKEEFKCEYSEKKIFQNEDKNELIQAIFYDNYKEKISSNTNIFAKLYSKDLLMKNKIKFKEGMKYGEDVIFNLISFQNAKKIAFINSFTYNYISNCESVTQKFDNNIIEHYTKMLLEIKEYLTKNNLYEKFKNEYQYFVLRQINKFCRLYFFRKENTKSYKELKKEFLSLLAMEPYYTAVFKEKIIFLTKQRKILLMLLKMKNFYILKQVYNKII